MAHNYFTSLRRVKATIDGDLKHYNSIIFAAFDIYYTAERREAVFFSLYVTVLLIDEL